MSVHRFAQPNRQTRRPPALRRTGRLSIHRTQVWLLTAFGTCFLAVGIPYWLIPSRLVSLPDSLPSPGLVAVGLAAFLLAIGAATPLWKIPLVPAASVPAAVFARVVADGLRDPTSHNLWPLEVMIAAGMGLFYALAGAVVGRLLVKTVRRRRRPNEPGEE